VTAETGRAQPIRVLHAVAEAWLERTQTWLYEQIVKLPPWVVSDVVCEKTMHLDEFPFPRVHSLSDAGPAAIRREKVAAALRLTRRLGWAPGAVRRLTPDVVHSHFGPTGWTMTPAVRRAGVAHVVTFYGLDVNYLPRHGWSGRYPELFRHVDRVLCEGPHMRECVVALGCAAQKVVVHRLGVDVAAIPFEPRTWRPGETLRVLLAASFREKKGLPYAIEALGRLRAKLPLEATILGGAGDSPESRAEAARIESALDRSGLRPHARMLGFQPHPVLKAEAARSHVFMAPSVTAANGDTEGGAPVTLLEMAASGMPIVATRHCDIPDIVEDGVSGLLAAERDVDGLVACLERLVAAPESWGPMLAAGRRRIEERHASARQAGVLASHYAELARPRKL
jgi:colanic acid/amylovoran biosynthesis glycosyltransferase